MKLTQKSWIPDSVKAIPNVPSHLTTPAEPILVRILYRLLYEIRELFLTSDPVRQFINPENEDNSITTIVIIKNQPKFPDGFDAMMDFLTSLASCSSAMQDIISAILIRSTISIENEICEEKVQQAYRESRSKLDMIHRQIDAEIPWEYRGCMRSLKWKSENLTLLEEFSYWQGRLHYPENINQLFLHLLPNNEFKEALTTAFIKNYQFTSFSLTKSDEPENLANRIVHVSVQLLANENTVTEMIAKYDFFNIFIESFKLLFQDTLISPPEADENNFTQIIDCNHPLIQKTTYWSIISDFNNIIHHRKVGTEFFHHSKAIKGFLETLNWFTGMDPHIRKGFRDTIKYF